MIENQGKFDSNTMLRVKSSRDGGIYECHRFTQYQLDLDLDTDADAFTFTLQNPPKPFRDKYVGRYTGLFTRFDRCSIAINSGKVLRGIVDNVKYIEDRDISVINITGRGMTSILIDNDAPPTTLNNVVPSEYIAKRCAVYGIKYICTKKTPVVETYDVNTGQSEIAVMRDMLNDSRQRLWFDYDTLYSGDWSTGAKFDLLFTRGITGKDAGISIEHIEIDENGGDTVKSKINIYGSTEAESNQIVGTVTNKYIDKAGIVRVANQRATSQDKQSKYINDTQIDIDNEFRQSYEIRLVVKTPNLPGGKIVLPNRVCHIIDTYTMTNVVMFITNVTYRKDLQSGSTMSITTIPSDKCLEAIGNAIGTRYGGLTGTSYDDPTSIMSMRKG